MLQFVFLLTLQSGDARFAGNSKCEVLRDRKGDGKGKKRGPGRCRTTDLCNFSFIFCKSGKFFCQKTPDRAVSFPTKNAVLNGKGAKKPIRHKTGKNVRHFVEITKNGRKRQDRLLNLPKI